MILFVIQLTKNNARYTYYNENYVIIEICYVRRIKSKISILHLRKRNILSKHELKLQQSRQLNILDWQLSDCGFCH